MVGPMALFPRSVLSWDVPNADHIHEESLSLFFLLQPKVDILVLGIGDEQLTRDNAFRILTLTRNRKLNVEILPTYQVWLDGDGCSITAISLTHWKTTMLTHFFLFD